MFLFLGHIGELADLVLDSLSNQRKQRVILVGHLLSLDTDQSRFEHGVLDLIDAVGQGSVDFLQGIADDVVDEVSLVGSLHLLSSLEQSQSSRLDVVLQVNLLNSQESVDGLSLDAVVVIMDTEVLDLLLSGVNSRQDVLSHVLSPV